MNIMLHLVRACLLPFQLCVHGSKRDSTHPSALRAESEQVRIHIHIDDLPWTMRVDPIARLEMVRSLGEGSSRLKGSLIECLGGLDGDCYVVPLRGHT